MHLPGLFSSLKSTLGCTTNDHPDQETLPLILDVMGDFIKATQIGVEASETRVNFWALCESLRYKEGEIIVNLLSLFLKGDILLT